MSFGPRLVGDSVLLREAVPADVEARRQLGYDAVIQRMFGAAQPRSSEMTRVAAERWVSRLGADGTVEWVVETQGSLVGTARLHSFAGPVARYAIGLLDPTLLGRGLGAEVTNLVLTHAFEEVGLDEVSLLVLEFNERAIRCYEKCGFRHQSRIDRAVELEGHWYDDLLMVINAEQFRSRGPRTAELGAPDGVPTRRDGARVRVVDRRGLCDADVPGMCLGKKTE